MLAGLRVDALDGSWKTFWTPARRPWGACLVVGALVVGSGGGKVHARPSPLSWTSKLSSKPKTRATRLQDLQMTHGMASRKKNFRSSLRPLNPYICIASISASVIGAGAHEPKVTSALPWDSTTNVKSCVVGERNAY